MAQFPEKLGAAVALLALICHSSCSSGAEQGDFSLQDTPAEVKWGRGGQELWVLCAHTLLPGVSGPAAQAAPQVFS